MTEINGCLFDGVNYSLSFRDTRGFEILVKQRILHFPLEVGFNSGTQS